MKIIPPIMPIVLEPRKFSGRLSLLKYKYKLNRKIFILLYSKTTENIKNSCKFGT